jgi:transposase
LHTARIKKDDNWIMKPMTWLEQHEIPMLPHPSKSPDISPIESIWGMMKGELMKRKEDIKSKEDLEKVIREIWQSD